MRSVADFTAPEVDTAIIVATSSIITVPKIRTLPRIIPRSSSRARSSTLRSRVMAFLRCWSRRRR
ncbi:hypothetical protein ITJ60_06550 [Curtobacterium sp. VKM Ac-2884]|nr:hypothetical protein [Curtobacterium sp. VKM Ac-2887]MBF4603552.1 hypothetical protein [Curtobacterium sp. VKM Ac-2884]